MGAEACHSDIDLDSDNAQPYTRETYQTQRDIGSVVYLPINEMYAITGYLALSVGLRADEILISSRGTDANEIINDSPLPHRSGGYWLVT